MLYFKMNLKARWLRVPSFLFLIGVAFNATAAIPPVEKLLPDDTLALVTTPDFARMREVYRSSPQTQFWDDPAMKSFKDKFVSKMTEELIQPLERDLGVHFSDYTNLPQGQITLAIIQNGWQPGGDQSAGLLLLLDTKDKNTQLMKNLAEVRKKWVEAGKTLRTEKIRNVEFSAFPISDKDIPKTLRKFSGADNDVDSEESGTNAPKNELFLGQYESLLIIGNSAKPIEKVLVHLTGGAMPSLGDLAAYEANRLALFRDAPLYGWVNTKAFVDLLTRKDQSKESDTPNPLAMFSAERIVTAIGLGGLKSIAFSLQSSADGTSFQVFAGVPESNREGIFKIFPGAAKDSGPPSFVPADAVKFERYRIDGQKTWAMLQKVMGDISPEGLDALKYALKTANEAAKLKDPDFDINKNLFGNLGDDLISYEKSPRGNSAAELDSPPSLVLIGSPNADQLASALQSILVLMSQEGGSPKEREFLGRKIYSVPLPSLPMTASDPSKSTPRSLSYASSGGYVALSTDASMLEEYLRSSESQQKTLRETPGLTDATAKIGGTSTGWFGFENQAETTRVIFEAARNGSNTNSGNSAMMPSVIGLPTGGTFKNWMDFSLLPPYEKVSKYFGFTVYTLSGNTDGLMFKMFAPVPAALRK
jgi:hypothetical protein